MDRDRPSRPFPQTFSPAPFQLPPLLPHHMTAPDAHALRDAGLSLGSDPLLLGMPVASPGCHCASDGCRSVSHNPLLEGS